MFENFTKNHTFCFIPPLGYLSRFYGVYDCTDVASQPKANSLLIDFICNAATKTTTKMFCCCDTITIERKKIVPFQVCLHLHIK